jgi:transcriptional regulator with XRE-family HTH domain
MSIQISAKPRGSELTGRLRREAGSWLRDRREAQGLSQRELARRVQMEYYTFISQIESGRGRVPAERLEAWAQALEIGPQEFAKTLMQYYDPITYGLIFPPSNGTIL